MQGVAVVAAFEQCASAAFPVPARKAQIQFAAHAPIDVEQRLARYAVVNDVHRAADGAAAVLQCARPAQHFDALDADRIGRHRMVVAQVGNIEQRATVVQDADPVPVLAANDGPAGVGAEVGAAHARNAVECFAQRRVGAQKQRFARVLGGGRY